MHTDVSAYCVGPDNSVHEAIRRMDATRRGIILVVDTERRLVGTVTDGDIRRAVLNNTDLNEPVRVLLKQKEGTRFATPLTAPVDADQSTLIVLFRRYDIRHLPVVDENQHVVGLVTLDECVAAPTPLKAVIMAGGFGQRLGSLTEETPKPMLSVGGRPLMELIIEQLRSVGIHDIHITTHHKSEKITEHFGDGQEFGVRLSYITEEKPLGTAGALGLMQLPTETTLVMNGDILTEVDFKSMLAYHREHNADLTMAVRKYELHLPYGVVECDGPSVRQLTEKPAMAFFVNAGIYLLEPGVYEFISPKKRLDMTELIQSLIAAGRLVSSFPIREYWIDIGEYADYEKAQEYMKAAKPTS